LRLEGRHLRQPIPFGYRFRRRVELGHPAFDLADQLQTALSRITDLQQQVDWFKRQLFGRTSERRLEFDEAEQASLFETLGIKTPPEEEVPTQEIRYRRREKRRDGSVNEVGLRFDETVPVEVIEVRDPAIESIRESGLRVYLSDPSVSPDTNHLERGLRPIPAGRRTWLFAWTELGARRIGMIQSLLATCQVQGVDPYRYLVDVLQRVDKHPAKRAIELTPRVWKTRFADRSLRSDLDRARDPPRQ